MPDFMNPAAAPGDPGFGGTFAATLTPDPSNTGDSDSDTQSATWLDPDLTADDVLTGLTAMLWEYKASLGPFLVTAAFVDTGAKLTASGLPLPLPAQFPLSAASLETQGQVNGAAYKSIVPLTLTDGTATTDPGTDPTAGDGTDQTQLDVTNTNPPLFLSVYTAAVERSLLTTQNAIIQTYAVDADRNPASLAGAAAQFILTDKTGASLLAGPATITKEIIRTAWSEFAVYLLSLPVPQTVLDAVPGLAFLQFQVTQGDLTFNLPAYGSAPIFIH